MPPRFIARQLSLPTGFLGRIVSLLMNQHNKTMNAFALRQLAVGASDRVLEIGFGGALNIRTLLAKAAFVAGVDPSPDVVRRAKARFVQAVRAGRADFREALVDAIPFDTASFGKICTVNTVYFWKTLDAGFAEMYRVLAPGGKAVVGFLPKEWMDSGSFPSDIFTARAPEDVVSSLSRAGFVEIRIERPEATTRWNVVVANR